MSAATDHTPRYCCRVQLQHYGSQEVVKVDTLTAAVGHFRDQLHQSRGWRDDTACSLVVYSTEGEPCLCDSLGCYHDYPVALWEVGPRGGVARQYV